MACRGVHFAISDDDLATIHAANSDDELLEVIESLEERWEHEDGFVCESDKAWDAIHRCLCDGSLTSEVGSQPLSLCFLGGEQLYRGDDYIITLVTHARLKPVVDALATVTPEFIAERYWNMPDDYDQPKSDEDCQYTWDWFSYLPTFFDRAYKAGRHVIFTVDQ